MSTPRRRYSRVQGTGRSQSQVAEDLGVSANTLCRWMKESRTEKADPFPGKGRQTSQAEPNHRSSVGVTTAQRPRPIQNNRRAAVPRRCNGTQRKHPAPIGSPGAAAQAGWKFEDRLRGSGSERFRLE